jgi:pyruvate/2-oxoglutarate dehydrogenase complex dihydrolipoamide acyltransferase (E2) component
MPTPVKMPRLGESVAEGTVGSGFKPEGDYVEKDESLAEIITDKINAELPSPIAGRLAKILVSPDETVKVGTDIALIEESADVSSAPPAHVTVHVWLIVAKFQRSRAKRRSGSVSLLWRSAWRVNMALIST